MASYVLLGSFTDQGIRGIKDGAKRAKAAAEKAAKFGVKLKDIYTTLGQYDLVVLAEAPDDAAVSALSLSIAAEGNVRFQTLRAFTNEERDRILDKL